MGGYVLNSFLVKDTHCPHSLGNQSIAAYCNSRGYEVELVSNPPDPAITSQTIQAKNPRVCGLSSNFATEGVVLETIRRLKKDTDIIVVVGGPSVSYSSKKSKILSSEADLYVRGDGEEPFLQILESLNVIERVIKGYRQIPGVFSSNYYDETVHRADLSNLSSPFPLMFETDHIYWETSRGCLFNCIYCAHPGKRKDVRTVPLERLIQEADYISKQNLRAIYITDPILGGTKERSKTILKLLKHIRGPFITAEYHPDFLDEETMDLLEGASIGWLEVGLQTTNPQLAYFRKSSQGTLERLRKLGKRNLPYVLDLIAGIPGDTIEGLEESIRFAIEEARPMRINIFPLKVYDGTVLHHLAESSNWEFDLNTRVIKKSDSFDKPEFDKWMDFGNFAESFYRFLQEMNWFGNEQLYRSIRFFKRAYHFARRRDNLLSTKTDYDLRRLNAFWEELHEDRRTDAHK